MNRKRIALMTWVLLLVPFTYFGFRIFTQDLGAQPATTLLRSLGTLSIRLLLFNLYIGVALILIKPFPRKLIWLSGLRRPLGIMNFVYLVFHLALYFVNEGELGPAFAQIFEKRYLTVSIAAWTILFVLAITSNDLSVHLLKQKRWKKLHRMVYVASILIFLHIVWIEKADVNLAFIYFVPLCLFQAYRLIRYIKSRQNLGAAS